jgi:hypothetical protein
MQRRTFVGGATAALVAAVTTACIAKRGQAGVNLVFEAGVGEGGLGRRQT